MAEENSTEHLCELRRIRIALYLIAFILSLIAFVLAMQFWLESTRPPRVAALGMRDSLALVHRGPTYHMAIAARVRSAVSPPC